MNGAVHSGIRRGTANTAICIFCAGVVLLAATTVAAPRPVTRTSVTLQLKWRHSFQFAGYYAAIEKGFYRDEGLQVSLVEGRPDVNFIDQVVSRTAEYGIATPELLLARQQGKPVVVLAAVFQHSPLILLTRKDSGLTSPHDLIHKTIMVDTNTDAEILAMFAKEGVSVRDVNPTSAH